jgi:hypothetical protein
MSYLTNKSLNKTIKKYDYNINELMKIIFIEYPNISKDDCFIKAKLLKRELNNINRNINRNTKKYFKHNLPFSYFENDENFLEYFDIQD